MSATFFSLIQSGLVSDKPARLWQMPSTSPRSMARYTLEAPGKPAMTLNFMPSSAPKAFGK